MKLNQLKVEFGVITHFNYELDGSDEKIEVATTRPVCFYIFSGKCST